MMLDATGNDEGPGGEGSRLLSSAASAYDSVSLAIFNDLTYSDDDEADAWEADYSSPDTAELMEEIISNAVLLQEEGRQAHLMHPLARQRQQLAGAHREGFGPYRGGSETDEASTLAYSITSTAVGDDDEAAGGRGGILSTTSTASYCAPDPLLAHPPSFDVIRPKGAVTIFRPPSPVFERSPRQSSPSSMSRGQHARDCSSQQPREQHQRHSPVTSSSSSSPRTTALKPKRSREFLVHQPPLAHITNTAAGGGIWRQHSSSPVSVGGDANKNNNNNNNNNNNSNNNNATKNKFQHHQHALATPLPFRTDDSSPATSATATDVTRSPPEGRRDRPTGPPPPEDHDAALRNTRRHRRLRKIRRAAEAREAAVREVRGSEQRGRGGGGTRCHDAPFAAFAFVCQFLLVSMSAFAFAPGALRDKVYGPLDDPMDGVVGEDGGISSTHRNPFAGLQTDDIIIPGGGTAGKRARGGHGGGQTFNDEDAGISRIDYVNVIQLVCIASGYACLCSLLALGFMMMLSKNLIHSTLIFTIAVSLVWTILGLIYGSRYLIIPVSGAVSLTMSFVYTVVVWDRISFATTNLSVALKGIRDTLVVIFVGLCVLAVTFLWTIWWMCAFIGTFNFLNDDEGLSNDWLSLVFAFYIFSYYWTFQVIKGISQTTVASIIGKWWDMSEDDPLPVCSSVLHRTITLNIFGSFGSICLASLIVDPCVLLTRIATFSRLARWRLSGVKSSISSDDKGNEAENLQNKSISPHSNVLSKNVNQWSYAYIGLYGYKFWESGSKASLLFEARGWTQVVSDDLIMTVMGMSSMIIGGSTAFMGLIVEEVDGYYFTSIHKPIEAAFLICLFVGFFLSNAFLSIVEGCVSAILVCYAAAPVEFHANHPKLSEEMKMVWKYFWLQKRRDRTGGTVDGPPSRSSM